MNNSAFRFRTQALEAIKHDVTSFFALILAMLQQKHASLLILGIVPAASTVVVESFDTLTAIYPSLEQGLSANHEKLFRASRHRAKLLDGSRASLDYSLHYLASELATIAENERQRFVNSHSGFLSPIKKLIQPDLGLSVIDDHVITTTHATIFNFGRDADYQNNATEYGEALTRYLFDVINRLEFQTLSPSPPAAFNAHVEMRDIKQEALYRRASLGMLPMEYAVGVTLLLASINYAHYVIRHFLPARDPTLFKLKFLVAFHTDSSLNRMQVDLRTNNSLPAEAGNVLASALGNSDSRWLRKRRPLRNLLMHYLPDEHSQKILSPPDTRREAIERFCGELSYEEVDDLLDRHLAHLSSTIERGFNLSGNPFWYGKVR